MTLPYGDLDDDDIAELAEDYGVSVAEVERYLAAREEREELRELARAEAEADDEEAEEFADEAEELADLWGVDVADVEALRETIGPDEMVAGGMGMTREALTEYIDDLYDVLTDEGFDLDVSDLWDMYYGYAPSGQAA